MRILIACEESQTECLAFRRKGYEAFSCDIKPCTGGAAEYHIQADVREILYDKWDMIIAHPPCTYLTRAGVCNLFDKDGKIKNEERYKEMIKAREFFMLFFNHPCKHIAIENPVPFKKAELPPYTQVFNPYEFGEDYSKQTCLWLKGLPMLMPTIDCRHTRGKGIFTSWTKIHRSPTIRSKSFPKVAEAMAEQWTKWIDLTIRKTLS